MKVKKAFKLCPHCDEASSEKIEMSHDSRGTGDGIETYYYVECLSCGSRGPTADSEARALVLWNVRHKELLK
jgi:Lar family restriction alleviation protein